MDIGTVTAPLTDGSATTGSVSLSVLKTVEDLQATISAELFQSLGVGTQIDRYA
ncbi:MAG TPA: hypothetical protein VMF11_10875 [Candidatus Baltobacteraceae bacterium]|nr:hypothetical protein [Candidatus Baltobacteraceae bacterium]